MVLTIQKVRSLRIHCPQQLEPPDRWTSSVWKDVFQQTLQRTKYSRALRLISPWESRMCLKRTLLSGM